MVKETYSSNKNQDKNRAKDGLNYETEEQCPICLDRLSNFCLTDPCYHGFHLQCLLQWSTDHNFCPVCRQVFDRIFCNYGVEFDVMTMDNIQSRVRPSLMDQRDALRQSLIGIRNRTQQQLEAIDSIHKHNNEEDFNRIPYNMRTEFNSKTVDNRQSGVNPLIAGSDAWRQHLIRLRDKTEQQLEAINSIHRQNNEEVIRILNEVRNNIYNMNQDNYQQFTDGVTGNSNMPPIGEIFTRRVQGPTRAYILSNSGNDWAIDRYPNPRGWVRNTDLGIYEIDQGYESDNEYD